MGPIVVISSGRSQLCGRGIARHGESYQRRDVQIRTKYCFGSPQQESANLLVDEVCATSCFYFATSQHEADLNEL
jgi:hypothetical protein